MSELTTTHDTIPDEIDRIPLVVMEAYGLTEDDLRIAEVTRRYYRGIRVQYEAQGPPSSRWAPSARERASDSLIAESGNPDSEVDLGVMRRVAEMQKYVTSLRRAMRVVETGGLDIPTNLDERVAVGHAYGDYTPPETLERRLQGDNRVGMEQALGSMARSASHQYDIKGGIPVRARLNGAHFDSRGNIYYLSAGSVAPYEPFAPAHQERAAELIRSLAVKQHERRNELTRRNNVKAAKEVIGRAGLRVPKSSVHGMTHMSGEIDADCEHHE